MKTKCKIISGHGVLRESFNVSNKKTRLNENITDTVTGRNQFEKGTSRGNNMGVSIIKRICKRYSNDDKIDIIMYDKNGRYQKTYIGQIYQDELTLNDGKRTVMWISEEDVARIEPREDGVLLTLDNDYSCLVQIYRAVNFANDP